MDTVASPLLPSRKDDGTNIETPASKIITQLLTLLKKEEKSEEGSRAE